MYAGILLCSLGVLMQEVLLTRIFSFTIWYHLAYVTISTALLGFGAAGSLLSAFPGLLRRDPRTLVARCAALSGIALVASLFVLGRMPLSPDRLLSEPGAFFLGLLGYYGAVLVPFLFAGIAVATPLSVYPSQVHRLYAADLFGAALGCGAAVAALTWLDGAGAVAVCAALLIGAGAAYSLPRRTAFLYGALACAVLVCAPFAHRVLQFVPTETKALGLSMRQPGTTMLFTKWSPVNRVDLYRDAHPLASFWSFVGLSHNYRGTLPPTLSIQYDGHNGSNVYPVQGPDSLAILDQHILRTPYLLHDAPRVLVIGVGGGIDVLNALRRGAKSVTGVELQPITVQLHQGPLAAFTGGSFQRPEVHLVAGEGRHYVRSHPDVYDIVQITAVDTFSAQTTGAYVLAESYLYTVEAFQDYLAHLSEDGVVSVVLGDTLYRDPDLTSPLATRLVMVARRALELRGVANPSAYLALVGQRMPSPFATPDTPIQGGVVGDLLVKRTPFTADEVKRLREFAAENAFLLVFAPGVESYAPVARLVRASAQELPQLLKRQPFVLDPVTDERPFFYHVLPWSALLSGEHMLWFFPGSSTGQLMLVIMLIQALVLGGALILLPLLRGAKSQLSGRATSGFLVYFLSLGIGFLLIEISFVQKYVLLLGYPTYSLSVTISSLLVFASLGSALSHWGWARPRAFLVRLLALTVGLVVLEVAVLPWVREVFLASRLGTRILVTCALQLPLGLALGMYFPIGAELLGQHERRLVPWAWGVNGVASVVSSVLAVILGMTIGFSGVALVAAATYTVGTLALIAVLPRDVPRP
ncbi:MAG TPA: hypothetical protein VEG67_02330 [Myxococcota bacterium]|nr:hypothetical protein [Myxococcota bacterium]